MCHTGQISVVQFQAFFFFLKSKLLLIDAIKQICLHSIYNNVSCVDGVITVEIRREIHTTKREHDGTGSLIFKYLKPIDNHILQLFNVMSQ